MKLERTPLSNCCSERNFGPKEHILISVCYIWQLEFAKKFNNFENWGFIIIAVVFFIIITNFFLILVGLYKIILLPNDVSDFLNTWYDVFFLTCFSSFQNVLQMLLLRKLSRIETTSTNNVVFKTIFKIYQIHISDESKCCC